MGLKFLSGTSMVKDVLFNSALQEDKQLLNGYAVKSYISQGWEAGFHYSSVLRTAEGEQQKARQMKMGSEEMWIFAQSSSDNKVTVTKALRLSALM